MNKITLLIKGTLLYPSLTLLFSILILVGYLLNKYRREKNANIILKDSTLEIIIQSYKISNIQVSFIKLITYFSITIGIFFLLRILNMGSNKSLFYLTFNISLINVILLFSIILLFGIFKIVYHKQISQEMFRVYLYLLTTSKGRYCIEALFNCYFNSKQNQYISDSARFLRLIQPHKEFTFIALSLYDNKQVLLKRMYYMRDLLKKKPILYFLVRALSQIAFTLEEYWWPLSYYFIYFVLFSVIIYDLTNEVMYYTYFVLPIFMLITLYRSVLSFIGTKDFYVLDPLLIRYLYLNQISIDEVLYYKNTIKEYLSNGYRGEHASDFFTEKTPSIDPFFIQVKRLYILISISITSSLLLFNMTLYNTLLLTLPLVLSFNTMEFNHVIVFQSKKLFKKLIFNISIISMVMINIWVYLTRHNSYFIREVVWNKWVIITQTFTIEEKKDFLYKYLNYTLNDLTIIEEIKGIILSKVRDEHILECLQEETTIQQIRFYVENLPAVFFRLERFYDSKLIEIYHHATQLANFEYVSHFFDEWLKTFVILVLLARTYFYMTNETRDIIISDNQNIFPKVSYELILKYFKSLFNNIL